MIQFLTDFRHLQIIPQTLSKSMIKDQYRIYIFDDNYVFSILKD